MAIENHGLKAVGAGIAGEPNTGPAL